MSEAVTMETPLTPKKRNGRQKLEKTKISHPKVSLMVSTAIVELKDRGGSSLQAIKKYIATTYKVDVDKLAPFIRKHLKMAVIDGSIIQTKGKGASGSFKISVGGKKTESKFVHKAKIIPKKIAKIKPKTVKSKKDSSKPKVKIAPKIKKVSKVKAKKNPVKARAPRPKKTMKKGSKLTKKAPKQSRVASK